MPRKSDAAGGLSLWFQRLGAAGLLAGQTFLHILNGKIHRRNTLEQMSIVGPESLTIALITAAFVGMVFTIQVAREFIFFGAGSFVGGVLSLALTRELAPVLTAVVVAGRVGSAFAAEIGTMRVTEQIDALYILRTDPIDYLVLPRVIACCLMMPIMMIFSLIVGIIGGTFAAMQFYQVVPETFLESVREFLVPSDIFIILLKGLIFGAIVAVNGCSWGLTTQGGAKEVGESATTAVVTTWVAIFIMDFILALLLFEQPVF